jgi:hypothetical protein
MSCDSHKRIAMGAQSIQAAEPKSQQPLTSPNGHLAPGYLAVANFLPFENYSCFL